MDSQSIGRQRDSSAVLTVLSITILRHGKLHSSIEVYEEVHCLDTFADNTFFTGRFFRAVTFTAASEQARQVHSERMNVPHL